MSAPWKSAESSALSPRFPFGMSNHKITYEDCHNGLWIAKCSCRRQSKIALAVYVAQWASDHENEVARVKALLARGSGTLKSERDWYLLQAANMENSEGERRLWQQLADEITRRLGDAPTAAPPDDTLF